MASQAKGRGFEAHQPLQAGIAQTAEHFHGKEEVEGSNPSPGSKIKCQSDRIKQYNSLVEGIQLLKENNSEDILVITVEGKNNLEKELEELIKGERPKISERLKVAIGFGDISENSEYDEAKKDQSRLKKKIDEIETILARAEILDEKTVNTEEAGIGSVVKIKKVGAKNSQIYRIVGVTEANIENGKISYRCPMGRSLMGHKAGDLVEVDTPKGKHKYHLISISK